MRPNPFQVNAIRPIQLSARGILEKVAEGRTSMSTEAWKDLLLRSVGLEPAKLSQRGRDMSLLRMVPFVERNYNFVELGPQRWKGNGRPYVREHGERPAWLGLPV